MSLRADSKRRLSLAGLRHAEPDLTEESETSPEAEKVINCRPVKFRPNPW